MGIQIEIPSNTFNDNLNMTRLEEKNATLALVAAQIFPAISQKNPNGTIEDVASLSVYAAKLIYEQIESPYKPERNVVNFDDDLFGDRELNG